MWDLSSPTRDQTLVPSIARQILNHWTTRGVLVEGWVSDVVGFCIFANLLLFTLRCTCVLLIRYVFYIYVLVIWRLQSFKEYWYRSFRYVGDDT